jgi:hypothetical protein
MRNNQIHRVPLNALFTPRGELGDDVVAAGLMLDTRPVPYVQSVGRVQRPVFHDTRPTVPRGIPMGPVTKAIEFGNSIPTRVVVRTPWAALVLVFLLGAGAGYGLGAM